MSFSDSVSLKKTRVYVTYQGDEANVQYFILKTGKDETTWHKWGNNIKVDHKKWDAKMKLDSPGIRSGPVAFCCGLCIILLSIKDGKYLEQLKDDKPTQIGLCSVELVK
jgi:hypothetical protein